ncbi:MAG: hypothetical protein AAF160_11765 [Pseudomonadota bacterium]
MQQLRARIAASLAGAPRRGASNREDALAVFERRVAAAPSERRSRALRKAVRKAAASVPADQATDLLRTLPERVGSRILAALVTRFAAGEDAEFRALVAEGDTARQATDWEGAECAYASALALYPLHAGYWIQLGHMRKELKRFAGAEAAYRSARALGAGPKEIDRHLAFVCRETGAEPGDQPAPTGTLPLDDPPIEPEVRGLWELMLDDPCDDTSAAGLMRLSPKRRIVEHLLDHPRFVARNRGFLDLLATGGEA